MSENNKNINLYTMGWRWRFGIYYSPVIIEVRAESVRILDSALKPLFIFPIKDMRLHRTRLDYLIFSYGKHTIKIFPLPGRLSFNPSRAQQDYIKNYNQSLPSNTASTAQTIATAGLATTEITPTGIVGAAGAAASVAGSIVELKEYFKAAAGFEEFSEAISTRGATVDTITDWRGALKMTAYILLDIVIVFIVGFGIALALDHHEFDHYIKF